MGDEHTAGDFTFGIIGVVRGEGHQKPPTVQQWSVLGAGDIGGERGVGQGDERFYDGFHARLKLRENGTRVGGGVACVLH